MGGFYRNQVHKISNRQSCKLMQLLISLMRIFFYCIVVISDITICN